MKAQARTTTRTKPPRSRNANATMNNNPASLPLFLLPFLPRTPSLSLVTVVAIVLTALLTLAAPTAAKANANDSLSPPLELPSMGISPYGGVLLSPFQSPVEPQGRLLLAGGRVRRSNCQPGYGSCGNIGAGDACCKDDTVCSRDAQSHLACCPTNAVCTGTLAGTGTSSNWEKPTTATAKPTKTKPPPTNGGSGGAPAPRMTSTVPDAPYPFYYIPTSYPDRGACSTAYSACQGQYSSCLRSLANSHVATITVDANNGKGKAEGKKNDNYGLTTTMAGDGVAQCQSLRHRACYGLRPQFCSVYARDDDANWAEPAASVRRAEAWDLLAGLAVAVLGFF